MDVGDKVRFCEDEDALFDIISKYHPDEGPLDKREWAKFSVKSSKIWNSYSPYYTIENIYDEPEEHPEERQCLVVDTRGKRFAVELCGLVKYDD